ncbi:MAG: GAF domain-containing sensor histidine kinase [Rubrobacteraceae bacterium]
MTESPDAGEVLNSSIWRRNHELSVLNEIARELNRSVNLDETLEFTLEQVAELLGLRTGWIWLRNTSTNQFYLAADRNLPPALAEDPTLMDGGSYCYCLDTYKKGDLRGAANVNVVTCSRLKGLVDGTDGLRHHASIPLYAGETKLGVMNVASNNWKELSPEDLQLLYTVGDLLSIAVERARLSEESGRLGAVEERNRLAREIHDSLAQGLTATALQLEAADAMLEGEPEPGAFRQTIRRALVLTRSNLEEARRSVLDLRVAPLEGRSLAQALRSLVEDWEEQNNIEARFEAVNEGHPLPPRLESALYRICQEALSNVMRHAAADKVTVSLVVSPERARLVIEDAGQGFARADTSGNHYGLTGMNERVNMLGGELEIQSAPGRGTRVSATIPLESS